ncbi:MAG: hypothetical protein ACOCTT_04280, partial [archaeon]
MTGNYQKIYFGGRSKEVWNQVEKIIEKEYEGPSEFFQHFILAFDGESSIKARIKMKDIKIQKLQQEVEELEREKEALKEKLENGETNGISMSM